jgi:hypothetical protein
MNYIKVKYQDYKKYLEVFNTDRIDKGNKISPIISSLPKFLNINEEILEGRETKYELVKNKNSYLIEFLSSNSNKYRFDLSNEPNTKIYHLSFSDSDKDIQDTSYENLTKRNESIDVFSRLVWILKDINSKINIDEYCIGGTDNDSKNKIYQYLMGFVSGWEKRDTNQYSLGWGIYFKV